MHVGIVAQKGNARAAYLAAQIREDLDRIDAAEVALDTATAEAVGDVAGTPVDELDACDLVVSIGGDGTFLFAARGARGTPLLGVNLGEVGFLNAVDPNDALDAVRAEVQAYRATGEVESRAVPRLDAAGDGWSVPAAVNEIGVLGPQRGHGNGVTLEVRVDGELYTGGRGDGVLVSTSTGSTAYNLSEGGPLLQPDMDALVVTEMATDDPMPSLVTAPGSEIDVRVDGAPHAVVSSDGKSREIETPDTVRIRVADEPVRLAGPRVDFFHALGKLE